MHKALGSGKGHRTKQLARHLVPKACSHQGGLPEFLHFTSSLDSTRWVLLLAHSGFFPSPSLAGNLAVLCFNAEIYVNCIATQWGKKSST